MGHGIRSLAKLCDKAGWLSNSQNSSLNIAQGIRTEGYSSVTIALLPLEQRKMALAPLEKAGAFGTKFVRWNAFIS
jgi:hypothetical protein